MTRCLFGPSDFRRVMLYTGMAGDSAWPRRGSGLGARPAEWVCDRDEGWRLQQSECDAREYLWSSHAAVPMLNNGRRRKTRRLPVLGRSYFTTATSQCPLAGAVMVVTAPPAIVSRLLHSPVAMSIHCNSKWPGALSEIQPHGTAIGEIQRVSLAGTGRQERLVVAAIAAAGGWPVRLPRA